VEVAFADLGRLLFADASDALLIIGADGRVVAANAAAACLADRPADGLVGSAAADLLDPGPAGWPADGVEADAVLRPGTPVRLTRRPVGDALLLTVRPAVGDAERLALAADAAGLGLWEYDPDTGALHGSEGLRRLCGVPPGEPAAKELFNAGLPPAELGALSAAVRRCLDPAGDGLLRHEYPYRRPDGAVRRFVARGRAYFTGDGAQRRGRFMVGVIQDVTERRLAEEALRASEARFRLLVDTIPYGIAEFDAEGRFVFVNVAHCRMFARAPEEFAGRYAWEVGLPTEEEQRRVRADLERFRSEVSAPTHYEIPVTAGDGRVLPVRVDWNYKHDADGRVAGIVAVVTDETARRQAEEALRAGERRLARIVEAAAAGILLVGGDGRITLANAAAAEVLGRPRDRLVGWPWGAADWQMTRLDGAALRDDERAERRVLRFGEAMGGVLVVLARPDGERAIVQADAVPLRDAAGRVDGMVVSLIDLTRRVAAERGLVRTVGRMRALSRRLMEVQEQERRHLARELHDEVGQALTGLGLTLGMAAENCPNAAGPLATARGQVQELLARVRDLSLRLRPSMLDDLGLLPALLWLFRRFTAQTGVQVVLTHRGVEGRFPPEAETAAYRIVQEALTNAARHGRVAEVAVRLWRTHGGLGLEVEDAGVGFDPEAATHEATGGLSGMRERAALLGGRLTVYSRPGGGTRIYADLPAAGAV
jgi:PAS domain S-box-containing protein